MKVSGFGTLLLFTKETKVIFHIPPKLSHFSCPFIKVDQGFLNLGCSSSYFSALSSIDMVGNLGAFQGSAVVTITLVKFLRSSCEEQCSPRIDFVKPIYPHGTTCDVSDMTRSRNTNRSYRRGRSYHFTVIPIFFRAILTDSIA